MGAVVGVDSIGIYLGIQ